MIYENARTLADEHAVADRLERLWGVRMAKPPGYGRDRIIRDHDGRLLGTVEIKARTNPRLRYPTYMIDLAKVAAMKQDADDGIVPLLVVQWTDWAGYIDTTEWRWRDGRPDGIEVGMGGRRDRNDPKDIDLCAFIPVEWFTAVQLVPRWRYTEAWAEPRTSSSATSSGPSP